MSAKLRNANRPQLERKLPTKPSTPLRDHVVVKVMTPSKELESGILMPEEVDMTTMIPIETLLHSVGDEINLDGLPYGVGDYVDFADHGMCKVVAKAKEDKYLVDYLNMNIRSIVGYTKK